MEGTILVDQVGMHDWAFIGVALTGQNEDQSICSKICKHCSASFQVDVFV